MHDLTAELKGYRDELAGVQPDTDRADLIRQQMNGVRAAIKDKADQLDKQADNQQAIGQDVPAAEARTEARRYRAAIEEHDAQTSGEQAGGEQDGDKEAGDGEAKTPKGRRPRGSSGKRDADAAKAPEQT